MTISLEWFGLVNKYIRTGQRADFENLLRVIRENGVPQLFGNEIADLLEGKLTPKINSIETKQREFYDNFLASKLEFTDMYNVFYKSFSSLIDSGLMPHPFNPKKFDKKLLNRMFSDKFYGGNLDSGRAIINRNIKNGTWPKFQ